MEYNYIIIYNNYKMEHNNNLELSTDEFLKKIEDKLILYIKKNNINFKKLTNTQKKLLMMKIHEDMWNDIYSDNKNDA